MNWHWFDLTYYKLQMQKNQFSPTGSLIVYLCTYVTSLFQTFRFWIFKWYTIIVYLRQQCCSEFNAHENYSQNVIKTYCKENQEIMVLQVCFTASYVLPFD